MIRIYSPQEVNMELVDNRDRNIFWDYSLEDMEDLLDSKDDEMFVLYGNRLVEINEDFLDEWE